MGIPSISLMLHELIKLLHHAKCQDMTITCISTSGGLGIEGGSVVIMDTAVDSSKPQFEQVVVDDVVLQSPELDKDLTEELSCSRGIPDFPPLIGHTTCTYDFCEGKIIFGCHFPPKHHAKSLCSYVGKTIHATEAQEGPQEQTHDTLEIV